MDADLMAAVESGKSAAQIAAAMSAKYGIHLTRNAVLGRKHRLSRKVPFKSMPKGRPKSTKGQSQKCARRRRATSKATGKRIVAPVIWGKTRHMLPLVDRDFLRQCPYTIWPHDAGRDHPLYGMCCGAEKEIADNYCQMHLDICEPERERGRRGHERKRQWK